MITLLIIVVLAVAYIIVCLADLHTHEKHLKKIREALNIFEDADEGRILARIAHLRVTENSASLLSKAWFATYGAEAVNRERARQIGVEGFGADHDDRYVDGELVGAAVAYLFAEDFTRVSTFWPKSWDKTWFKPMPEDRIRNLVKAASLIVAEIDREFRRTALDVALCQDLLKATKPLADAQAALLDMPEIVEEKPGEGDHAGEIIDHEDESPGKPMFYGNAFIESDSDADDTKTKPERPLGPEDFRGEDYGPDFNPPSMDTKP